MVRLGINLMAWAGSVGEAELGLLPGIAEMGYDGVELPIFAPEAVDARAVRAALERTGLACTVSSAVPRGASLITPAERLSGSVYLQRVIETAAACGATIVCGPLYAPVGQLPGRPRTRAEWDCAVGAFRTLADAAARHGVTLALEVLNRFETHFLNTTEDALAFLAAVDHPNVGLHVDTFHMNVEEKSLPEALRRATPRLAHVHAAENDRGIVGSGHVDWVGVRDALSEGNYGGWVVAETFTGTVPEIAAATAIWREIVPDAWTYAR